MKVRNVFLAVVLLLTISAGAFADRQLDRTEVLQVFQQLTSQPKKTWIPAGTINATHEEYRAAKTLDPDEIRNQINQKISEYQNNPNKILLTENLQKMQLDAIPFNVRYKLSNEYTMVTAVTVKYDGNKFYWDIDVSSRTDSVKPGKNLEGNYMTEDFHLEWNGRRIFAWDGEKHTTYSLSVNNATVDATGEVSRGVTGPLTAGFVPWGYGRYSYDNLSSADSTAVEKVIDGRTQIHLTLNNLNYSDGMQFLFVLDAAMDYAVLSCSIETDNKFFLKEYSNYQSVAGNWVPATISLRRFDAETNSLLASDLWQITTIDGQTPQPESFEVEYQPDALVEYDSVVTAKPAMYRCTQFVDTEALLAERLTFAANENAVPQNCATVSLKYALGRLGIEVSDSQLAELVDEQAGQSDLYAMKQFAQGLGLHCRAVQTDIETLRHLDNCQVILHIPAKGHFVVLEGIDNNFVRIIDLASDRFYYRTDVSFFGMGWTEGTALVLAANAITGDFVDIGDAELGQILGAEGYTCTLPLQSYLRINCDYIAEECTGNYYHYWQRKGCESAASGGCTTDWMKRVEFSPCIEQTSAPWNCVISDVYLYYMHACE